MEILYPKDYKQLLDNQDIYEVLECVWKELTIVDSDTSKILNYLLSCFEVNRIIDLPGDIYFVSF